MSSSVPKRWDIGDGMYEAYEININKPSSTHWHSCFLLTLVTDGAGTQRINGKTVEISAGSVIVLSPTDFHSTETVLQSIAAYGVKFSDKIFYDSLAGVCRLSDFPIVTTLDEGCLATAVTLFKLLLEEQRHTLSASHIFALDLIEELVILALRAVGAKESDAPLGMINRALTYIHCNFRSHIQASDVAGHVGYSPNYFSAEFKRQTGVEFRKYLRDARLEFAKKLLQHSTLSVTEVCFECGFHTHQHFSRAFKNKFGVTPEGMKEKNHEKINKRIR